MLSPVRKVEKSLASESSTQSIITARLVLKDEFYLNSPSVLEESLADSNPNHHLSIFSASADSKIEELQNNSCKCLLL
jgi:hypothetical protein